MVAVFFVFKQSMCSKSHFFFIKILSLVWYTSMTSRAELTLVDFIQYTYHMEQTNQQMGFNEVQIKQLSTIVHTIVGERITASLIEFADAVMFPHMDLRFDEFRKDWQKDLAATRYELKDYIDRRLNENTSEIFMRLERRLVPLEKRLA